jgi:hypothetical protein
MQKLQEKSFQRDLNTSDHFNIFVIILPEYPFNNNERVLRDISIFPILLTIFCHIYIKQV